MENNINYQIVGSKDGLVTRVMNQLEELILTKKILPNTKLPPQRELAEQLGVSRTVVREAVRILVTKGLLETQHGVGTIVKHLTSEQLTEPLSLLIRANGENTISLPHIQQVRSILEIEIAGLAAKMATKEDIDSLFKIWDRMKSANSNFDVLIECDLDFHRFLGKMTGNPLLVILLDSIRDLLQRYIRKIINHLDPQTDILPAHYAIIESIKSGNVEEARAAMSDHQNQMIKNYEKYLSSSNQKSGNT